MQLRLRVTLYEYSQDKATLSTAITSRRRSFEAEIPFVPSRTPLDCALFVLRCWTTSQGFEWV